MSAVTMPELPEVETMCRGIQPVVGARIRRIELLPCRLKPMWMRPEPVSFCRKLRGRTIQRVERLGKRVLIHLSGGWVHIFEPRMTGLVLLADPPNQTHLRVRWHLSGEADADLWFWDRRGLGTLAVIRAEELPRTLGPEVLGPDALALKPGQLRQRLGLSTRAIKVALLDQRAVAGIGNLYAAEILHVAGVHPAKRCRRLTRAQWLRVESAIDQVLREAIRYEGSTLADGTYRNALNQAGTYQNHHRVYARQGLPCFKCQTPIRRMVQMQRATFWCPTCQRR